VKDRGEREKESKREKEKEKGSKREKEREKWRAKESVCVCLRESKKESL
jgi:hypothetical protein